MTVFTWLAMVATPALAQEAPAEETETTEEPAEESTETPADPEEPAPEPTEAGPTEDDLARAVELFNNGKSLFDEANYADAITAWEASYDLSKKPALLFNIASAHERQADYESALQALNRYRAFAKPDEKDALERRMKNLEKLRDEAAAAATPAPQPEGPEPSTKGSTSPQKIVGYGLVGVGAIGIGTGIATGLASSAAGDRSEANCVDGLCLIDAKSDIDQNRSLATVADAGLIGGIVAAGVGVALIVTSPSTKVQVGPSSLTFVGRF